MPLTEGAHLGPYEILAAIGAGGMGEVYRARDTKLNRDVAMKVLPESFANDHDRLSRFQREAETLASLNHPNIAHIHGLEESGGVRALVMELVEGEDLSQRLRLGSIALDEALHIARQIAEALEAAHGQGIIHRDLKPANIKVRPDGVVKVLDFGLAKAMEPAGAMSINQSMSPTITTPAMTQAGVILGTAAYMSPEQARGKPVDKRADIWAFGCVLFEMLTGRRAFDAEDVSLTLAEVMKSEPDWTTLSPLPPMVRMCLRQCLKKDPRQRLRDIGDARLALEGAFDVDIPGDSSAAAPTRARRVWLWVLPFAAGSAIVAASLSLWLQTGQPPPLPQVVRFEIHAPKGSTIPPSTPAISPDGRTLAYAVNDPDGTTRIHLRGIGSIESRPLPGTEKAAHPFWSADGRSLAFVAEGSLKRIDIAGGPPREMAGPVGGPWHGSWNQFGDVLFLGSVVGVSRVHAEGGTPTPAVVLNEKAGETSSSFPMFLPDGRRFLTRIGHGAEKSAIHLAWLDSPERKLILDDVWSAALVAPTPGGSMFLLYLRDDDLLAQEFDERAGEVRGRPRVLVDGIGRVAAPALMPTAGVSPSGTIAYQTGGDFGHGVFSWLSRSGQLLGEVSLEVSGSNPSLSPDGDVLAVDADLRGNRDIWVSDLARGVTSRLTTSLDPDVSPIWSPDGKRLAFLRSGKIYVKDADASAEETVLAEVSGAPRSWSPDGKYLLYEAGSGYLFLWPLTGGGPPVPVGSREGLSRGGRLSPDGRCIAYSSNESGRAEIYLQPVPPATGRIKLSASGGVQPRWSPDNREVFFIGGDRSLMVVDVALKPTLSAGVPRKLFPFSSPVGLQGYDVSKDGQRLLMTQVREDLPDTPITVVLNWWAEFAKRPN
jgi:Tol biopolymer transport system component